MGRFLMADCDKKKKNTKQNKTSNHNMNVCYHFLGADLSNLGNEWKC